eukprot:Plantae.Rhodophyta-Purpureofilum_apyrenoidigerum.ctg5500.p1 GENE.Plantae.Rhodophyta-Purpureofilum_apyrenoidigerum.ctg5500~~Plantae.Rhodophyta-Purpureofilum_apyrenoidigerum.ctg5500.p1  ORF type:complete len:257 (-),score=39.59 Plantae.Rhodophyta-Purpureofilum_apyrenoidigerum.ctg5500:313-1083(-)
MSHSSVKSGYPDSVPPEVMEGLGPLAAQVQAKASWSERSYSKSEAVQGEVPRMWSFMKPAEGSRSSSGSPHNQTLNNFMYDIGASATEQKSLHNTSSMVTPMTPETQTRGRGNVAIFDAVQHAGPEDSVLEEMFKEMRRNETHSSVAKAFADQDSCKESSKQNENANEAPGSAKVLDKRSLRLLRNRESALRSRRQKKADLERLEQKNRGLHESVRGLEQENSNLRSHLNELLKRYNYTEPPLVMMDREEHAFAGH